MAILQGPFSTFKYPIETGCDWTGIKFSLDGKMMMLTTNGAVIRYLGCMTMILTKLLPIGWNYLAVAIHIYLCRVIDAYEGKPMFTLAGYQNNKVGIIVQLLYQYSSIRTDLIIL